MLFLKYVMFLIKKSFLLSALLTICSLSYNFHLSFFLYSLFRFSFFLLYSSFHSFLIWDRTMITTREKIAVLYSNNYWPKLRTRENERGRERDFVKTSYKLNLHYDVLKDFCEWNVKKMKNEKKKRKTKWYICHNLYLRELGKYFRFLVSLATK